MVQIKDFISTSQQVATQQRLQDPNVFTAGDRARLTQTDRFLSQELSRFDQISSQADRAKMIADEAKFNSSLLQAGPRVLGEIAKNMTTAMDQIQRIDEAEREAELKRKEDIYLLNEQIAFQEKFLNFQEQAQQGAAPDGAGYRNGVMSFINDEMKGIMERAPSEASKLEMYKDMSRLKLNAMTDANDFERRRRKEFVGLSLEQSARSLGAQAFLNSGNTGEFIDQLSGYKGALKAAGLSPVQAEQAVQQASGIIYESAVKGRLAKGDYIGATALINSPAATTAISNSKFINLHSSISRQRAEIVKQEHARLEQQRNIDMLKLGILPQSNKDLDRAANSLFEQELQQSFMNADGTSREGVTTSELAAAAVNIYNKYPSMPIPSRHKQILSNSVLNGSPEVAIENAQIIGALSSDPDTAGKVAGLDSQVVAEAHKILGFVKSGIAPDQAVENARKILRVTDPNRINSAKKQVQELLKTDRNIADDLIDDALGVDEGIEFLDAKIEAESLLQDLTAVHGDIDIAKEQVKTLLNNKYKVSKFNGDKEIMKYAPEKYYDSESLELMKDDFTSYLKDIATNYGGDAKDVGFKSRFIGDDQWEMNYKDNSGDTRTIAVKLKDIQGITNRGSDDGRLYMLVNKETNLPVLKSQLNPADVAEPITYNFELSKTGIFEKRKKEVEELAKKDREWRLTKQKENAIIQEEMEREAKAREINENSLTSVKKTFKEIFRFLGAN